MIHYSNTSNPVDFPISPETMKARCNALLTALVGKTLVDNWWKSPNKAFDGATPAEVFEVDPGLVLSYLMKFYEGGGS